MKVEVRHATRADLSTVARIIAKENASPERQCLHLGEEPEEILTEMHAYTDSPEKQTLLALRANDGSPGTGVDTIVGILGAELEPSDGHTWLWGPYVLLDDEAEWTTVANTLLDRLPDALPVQPTIIDSFVHVRNVRADAFLRARGFSDAGVAHVYVAKPPGAAALAGARNTRCVDLPQRCYTSFAELHDLAFPGTFFTPGEIIEKCASGDRVLVTLADDGETVTGYVHAGIGDGGSEGYVHFLAVRPGYRGRGLGRALLEAAMGWLFSERAVPQIGLNVREGLDDARALYERVGFRLAYTGQATRLHVNPESD